MFDFVHEKKRIVQIILALVILPFAFWGMDSYNRSGNSADAVATVNDTKITQREFEYALRLQQNNLREMMGENFDAAMLNSPEMKRAVMDNLIEKRLLIENARDAGLAIPDEQLAQVIASIEAFQDNGNFDKQRYETALAGQGMSSLMFETRLRDDLLAQQVRDAYAQNGFVSNSVAENVIRLNEQQRTVSVSALSFKFYLAKAIVDEAAVKEYYQQNQKAFRVPEQAKVEYVRFSVNDLMSRAEVSDEDARRYYDDRPNEFGTAEERQAAHILISAAASAPQAEQDAAKAKAEKLLQQVRQDPAKFAELARQHSQDPGSAANGGDLGFFGRSMMVKPFEDATFALKQDEISGLVKSDFGYHIIKLLAVKPAGLLSFDEVQESILNKLRLQKATDLFAELAEKFNNTVYEQSDTLKPAADLVGAKIEQSEWLDRETAPDGIWTAKMLQEIFSEETLKNKRNTAAIEVEANTLVAARILEYKPASMRTLDEVQETINQKLLREQAVTLAAKQGKALLEQLQRGDKPALDWEAAQTVTRARRGSLDADMIRKVFQADAASLPQFVGAETPQEGYLLVRIDAVKEGEKPDDERRAGYAQQIRQLTGEEMLRAYLADARQQATVAVNLPETTEQP